MENNEINKNETQINQNLTNEQKLEYISNLIQQAEENLENSDLDKKVLVKSDESQ